MRNMDRDLRGCASAPPYMGRLRRTPVTCPIAVCWFRDVPNAKAAAEGSAAAFGIGHREEALSVLGRPGSDLLSQVLRLSTIGAEEFNGRVRDGIGYGLLAITTRPAKDRMEARVGRQHSR